MKDYSHLKGKEVSICLGADESAVFGKGNWKGFVADIDYKNGITIKHKGTEEDLLCINKDTVEVDSNDDDKEYPSYDIQFNFFVKCIENGKYLESKCPLSNYLKKNKCWKFSEGMHCAFE